MFEICSIVFFFTGLLPVDALPSCQSCQPPDVGPHLLGGYLGICQVQVSRKHIKIFDLHKNCNFAVGSSVGWVCKLRSLQERCGTTVSSPSWARRVPFFPWNIFMILCVLSSLVPSLSKMIIMNYNKLWGDSVLHGFNLFMNYCHTSSRIIVQVNSKQSGGYVLNMIHNKQTNTGEGYRRAAHKEFDITSLKWKHLVINNFDAEAWMNIKKLCH